MNENWTTGIIPDYTGEDWPSRTPGCGTTLSSDPAEAWDFIQGVSNAMGYIPVPFYNTQQNGAAVFHWGQEWRVGTCTIGAGPRVQTNTHQIYVDHAAHTPPIVSPAP